MYFGMLNHGKGINCSKKKTTLKTHTHPGTGRAEVTLSVGDPKPRLAILGLRAEQPTHDKDSKQVCLEGKSVHLREAAGEPTGPQCSGHV